MTDTPLIREPQARSRRPLLIGIIAVVLLAAAVAAAAWWYFSQRTPAADWERVPAIGLLAPAGDAFIADTPWVTLQLEPARAGQANTVRLSLLSLQGTPIPSDSGNHKLTGLTAQPVGSTETPTQLTLEPEQNASGALLSSFDFPSSGWWRLSATVENEPAPADFFLLIPDPNINGPAAVPANNATSEGEALYQRGLNGITSLQSVHYTQWLADGRGNAGISEHTVTAGGEGKPPGFAYRAAGGMEAIVIGSTRWIHLPGDLGWTKQEGAASVPPSQWGEEYAGATGFTILGEEMIDGAQTQILSFVVPEVVEPRRQSAAWYLWWVDTESGHVRREAMVSRVHYMQNRFADFDAPVNLEPPALSATPGAGTPIAATPGP